ncbi:hypothetical protein STEG23_020030, partial [Scotinomys teguina]
CEAEDKREEEVPEEPPCLCLSFSSVPRDDDKTQPPGCHEDEAQGSLNKARTPRGSNKDLGAGKGFRMCNCQNFIKTPMWWLHRLGDLSLPVFILPT